MIRYGARVWLPALLAVWPLLVYWPGASGEILLGPGDGATMFLPLRVFAADSWRHGAVPLWNPWVFSGFPLLGAMTAGVLYPLSLLYLVCAPPAAMNWSVLATFAACGLATYAYARAIGCTRAGAFFAGLTFAGSGFLAARIGNTPLFHATPWLPVLLLAIERLRAAMRLRWVATGAGAVTLSLLAGHPQLPAYSLGTAVAYAAVRGCGSPPAGRVRFLAAASAAIAGGILLAAPQLLPAAELAAQSVRDRLSYEAFLEFALAPRQLGAFLFPLLWTAAVGKQDLAYVAVFEQAGYVGIAALVLALGGGAAWRRSPVVAFWALTAIGSLALSLGAATPLARLAFDLPVLGWFRIPTRHLFQFDFAIAVLGGIGLSGLQRGAGRRAVVLAAVAMATAMVAIAVPPLLRGDAPAPLIWIPLGIAAVAVALLLVLVRRPSALALALLALLQGADLWLFAQGFQPDYPLAATILPVPPWVPPLRAVAAGDRGAIVAAGGVDAADYRLALAGQRLVQGYDSLLLRRYAAFAGDMDYAGRISESALVYYPEFLDLLNTRAVLLSFADRIPAAVEAGGVRFAFPQLGLALSPHDAVEFTLPTPRGVRRVAAVSFLGGAVGVGQGDPAIRVTVFDAAGVAREVALRAGEHTAEWAWDRADVRAIVRHQRAPVAERFAMGDAEANQYVGVVDLGDVRDAVRVRFDNVLPQSTVQLSRLSLIGDDGTVTPLTLAHLLLSQPERWVQRAAMRYDLPPRQASPVLTPRWLRALLQPGAQPAAVLRGELVVLENRQVLPPAWLVSRTIAVDGPAALASVRTGLLPDGSAFDPRAVALVAAGAGEHLGAADPEATAAVVARSAQRLEIATHSRADAFLVTSEIDYPGWNATVDDAPAAVVATDAVLRGVRVPAGAHRVVFEYRPRSFRTGAILALFALVGFAAAGLWRRRAAR